MSALHLLLDSHNETASVMLGDQLLVAVDVKRSGRGETVGVRLGDTNDGPMLWFVAWATDPAYQTDPEGGPWIFPSLFREDKREAYEQGYSDADQGFDNRYDEED